MKLIVTLKENRKWLFIAAATFLFFDLILIKLNIVSRWVVPVFVLSFLSITILLLVVFQDRIKRFLHIPVLVENLPLTRVTYGALCLVTAVQHITLIPSGLEPGNFKALGLTTPGVLAYFLSAVYIFALISLIAGKWIRLSWILIFACGGLLIPFSLETFVKNPINFFCIFVPPAMWRGEKTNERNNQGWPLVMLGLTLSLLITSAGVFKAFDPIWQKGLGLYYSLNIPFFFPKHLWFLLDYQPIMVAGNWICIIVETLAFPLFLFIPTRKYAVLFTFLLGCFLAYAMAGIGLVGGPVIIAMIPALLAISGVSLGKRVNVINNFFTRIFGSSRKNSGTAASMPRSYYTLGFVVFVYTLIGFLPTGIRGLIYLSYWPPQYEGYQSRTQWLPLNKALRYRLHVLETLSDAALPHTFYKYAFVLPLFDYHHLFDRIIFRVVYVQDGQLKQGRTYFNDDGSLSENYPLMLNERFFFVSGRVTYLMFFSQNLPDKKAPTWFIEEFNALIKYSLNTDELVKRNIREAKIQVKILYQPVEFAGNSKPWANTPWKTFYVSNLVSGTGYIVEIPRLFNYRTLSVPAFKNLDIISDREMQELQKQGIKVFKPH